MSDIYGIDLGTSNCLVALLKKVGSLTEVECLTDENADDSFPSIVHFPDETSVVVGERAKEMLDQDPDKTIELVKIRVGRYKIIPVTIGGEVIDKTPTEISAIILRHFNFLHDNRIERAVLSVPAYFDDNQKKATLQAGLMAGIDIIEMIEEPSAAAMYYLFELYRNGEYNDFLEHNYRSLLIFDFGGGTLDLSVVNLEIDQQGNLKPKVVYKGGDMELGGNNIDFTFTAYLIRYLYQQYDDDFIEDVRDEYDYYRRNYRFRPGIEQPVKQFIMRLKDDAEKAKIELSGTDEIVIDFHRRGYKRLRITRKQFEEGVISTPDIRGRIVAVLREIAAQNINIDQVVLVGGSSQIPSLENILESAFPELQGRIVKIEEYSDAVVKGTAILGAILSDKEIAPFGKNRCFNSVSHDIYVRHGEEPYCLVKAGIPYPFNDEPKITIPIARALCTSIDLSILEQYPVYNIKEEQRIKELREIEQVRFFHPFFYRGDDLSITLRVDDFGLISYMVNHVRTNEGIEHESECPFALTEQQLAEKVEWIESLEQIE